MHQYDKHVSMVQAGGVTDCPALLSAPPAFNPSLANETRSPRLSFHKLHNIHFISANIIKTGN